MAKKAKQIKFSDVIDFICDHETLVEDFKNHFGVAPDEAKFKDIVACDVINIDISKDPDWKDSNPDEDLLDYYDISNFIETKYGSNTTWFSLEQAGESNTYMLIDDATGNMSKLYLFDSSKEKQKSKGCK